jgi:hypothetical protein
MRKSDVIEILERMPDDLDAKDLIYRFYVLQKVELGEAALAAGLVLEHEEVVRVIDEWRE